MRDNPARMTDETASTVAQFAPAHADAIEIFADVLAQSEEEGLGDDFYSRLCEGITRCTALRRVVIFRYDSTRRRILAAGAFGVDLALFAGDFFTLESAAIAREALEQDRVLESSDTRPHQLPAEYVERLATRTVVCSPISARGRWLGAILGDRGGDGPPLTAPEREVLWILGKMAALAAMARAGTRQHERAVALEQRIDLAREVHEGVVQRLFGVSLALSGDQPFDEETRRRCADEVQEALGDLRTALQRPLSRSAAATRTTLAEEVARLQHEYRDLGIEVEGEAAPVPEALEPLAQSVLSEAIRNAAKHSHATRVGVRTEVDDGTFVLEVTNDGVESAAGGDDGVESAAAGAAGMGLRLAGFEALQAGGLLEFGAREQGRWQVRLVVPFDEA
jgi:signal transduction histidine kinase